MPREAHRIGHREHQGRGELLHLRGERGIAAQVLALRIAAIEEADRPPDHEIENRPPEEEGGIEEYVLLLDELRLGRRGVDPFVIQIAVEQRDRNEQQRSDGQEAGQPLHRSPRRHRPSGAGQVLDEHQDQAAQADGERELEAGEPGEGEAVAVGDGRHHRQQDAGDGHGAGAGEQPAALLWRQARDVLPLDHGAGGRTRPGKMRGHHFAPWGCGASIRPRSAAGTSATVAC